MGIIYIKTNKYKTHIKNVIYAKHNSSIKINHDLKKLYKCFLAQFPPRKKYNVSRETLYKFYFSTTSNISFLSTILIVVTF